MNLLAVHPGCPVIRTIKQVCCGQCNAILSDLSCRDVCGCIDNGGLVAMMCGHSCTIHAISMHDSGRYAMTTSSDMAQLWDLDSFQRKRKLTVKEDVPIVKVHFRCVSILC